MDDALVMLVFQFAMLGVGLWVVLQQGLKLYDWGKTVARQYGGRLVQRTTPSLRRSRYRSRVRPGIGHDVVAVANAFIGLGIERQVALKPSRIQALCWLADEHARGILGRPLVADQAHLGAGLQFYERLYNALCRYGQGVVQGPIHAHDWAYHKDRGAVVVGPFSDSEQGLIQSVFEAYAESLDADLRAFCQAALLDPELPTRVFAPSFFLCAKALATA